MKLGEKELSIAQSDLSDAKAGFENQRSKWSTIQAYYAMFHTARALIYSRGYREKSHYCLAVALKSLFVDEGMFGEGLGLSILRLTFLSARINPLLG